MAEIKGWHVATGIVSAFGVIIAVNVTLAVNAVRTFPGLETKNSYVVSQKFEATRAAQKDLNWDVAAWVEGDQLTLRIQQNGKPVAPEIVSAVFGRATSVAQDQVPEFTYANGVFVAPIKAGQGNWNLRLKAMADDGTVFEQRVIVGRAA